MVSTSPRSEAFHPPALRAPLGVHLALRAPKVRSPISKGSIVLPPHRLSEKLEVRVSDFGLARDVYSSDYYRASQGAKLPVKWMPPEALHDSVSNEKTDMV